MKNNSYPNDQLIETCQSAKNVFVFTGAGISKESGLPTFREADGLWKKYDPMTLASMEGFNKDPVMVWNMYRLRQRQISSAKPNPAHVTLARMEKYYPHFLIATQNVDDLHERGGSQCLVKIHGDAWQMRCLGCGKVYDVRDFDFPDEFEYDTLPRCAECESLCRPNIVWFGEYLPEEPMMRAYESACNCDLMFVIGTSGTVSGGYGFCERAIANGAKVIEVNPTEGALTHYANFWVKEPAGEALPRIWEQVAAK